MKELSSTNADVARTVENGNQRLNEIVGLIKEISDKTKVINEIVFQTRLLSFNASVEAARAGDQGKGFSVVTEEVGNLAQMSGKSAAEITAILDVSISKVQEIVEESKRSVDKILESSKSKTNEGLRIASECSDVLEKISIASTEQAKGINEIAKAMGNIDQSTNETSILSNKVKVTKNADQQ